ncbi:putative virion structural protein [Erwinia phage vB_EamM_MadMel]|uniref:Putative virion structural protein n=2 Tax=Agricanvirus specialG TaxID=1984781 RepID=A0A191ZBQ8_9CAUD|nr:putative virion structural protein [Erwinia phage vB_EamM_Special G]ANJ64826.1 putative virion structural protein [Erwinia phage vB_EamM_Special G]AUG86444.1 putative virion structural protein [Erwinia phage vB_EamM_MadMel]
MYNYVACISKTVGKRPKLVADDISSMQLKTVLQTYSENRVILSSPFLKKNVCLVLQDYYNEVSAFNGTLVQWLASLGNRALATSTTLPNLTKKSALFNNLNEWWFTQKPTNITSSLKRDFSYADANDVILMKEGVDYPTLFNCALFTVNGYLHRSSLSDDGIYLLDACKNAKVSNDVKSGVLSFHNVSTLKCYSITADQLQPSDELNPYRQKILMSPPFSTQGKSVGIVIGGIFYWQDEVISILGEGLVSLSTVYIDWVDRYFYDREFIDLSSIPANINPDSPRIMSKGDYQKDDFYKAWLLLSTSFWVVFDNPLLEVEQIPLETHKWPGMFTVPDNTRIPIQLNNGVMAEPLLRPGEGRSRLLTLHHRRRFALNTTIQYRNEDIVTDYGLMPKPWVFAKAWWLKISTY